MENGSACLTTELGCSGFGNMGMLLLSLGITVALVGSLFYYVRQRFEVLEVSHKEQIGVMQNFIASIGDQFQRMHSFIQQQSSTMFGGATKEYPPTAAAAAATTPQQSQQSQQSPPDRRIQVGSLIDVSDTDSDSEYSDYDDDSATSDTDAMEFGGAIKIHDELYVENDDDDDDDNGDAREYAAAGGATETIVSATDPAFDIKIIELTHISPHPPCNRDDAGDDDDSDDDDSDDDDSDDDDSDDDDSDDDGDNGDNGDDGDDGGDGDDVARLDNHIINVVTVIKNDSTYCEPDDKIGPADVGAGAGAACRSMVVDLDLGELLNDNSEPTTISPIPITGDADTTIVASAGNKSYAHMSIKQMRKLVKIHNIDIQQDRDISKLKREQLSKILEANAIFQ